MRSILYFLLPLIISGCSNFTYYMDVINGHHELLEKSQPINSVITEDISKDLKNKLVTFKQARLFATQELLLPDNDSYKSYADIGRPFAVWNVIATEKYSVDPKQWCFFIVGCLSYRGYFSKQEAEEYAWKLRGKGYDTYVSGARAYSTLGWFDDPLLNTMMYKSEARRVGIMFHELAHQKLYVEDDTSFNEAFAMTIEQEGVKRWLAVHNKRQQMKEYLLANKRKKEFNLLLQETRSKLIHIYRGNEQESIKEERKMNIFSELKKNYKNLKNHWQGYSGYDEWMTQDLNNAHLAIVATYHDLVPVFKKILKNNNYDLVTFYKKAEKLSIQTKSERSRIFQRYLNQE